MTVRLIQGGVETINLDGPNGNAYYLMGTVSRYSDMLNDSKNDIIDEMCSSDYTNLCKVFQKHLPFVVLETSNPELLEAISC